MLHAARTVATVLTVKLPASCWARQVSLLTLPDDLQHQRHSGTRHGYVANFCCVLFSTAGPPCAVAEYKRYRMAAAVLARPLVDYQH